MSLNENPKYTEVEKRVDEQLEKLKKFNYTAVVIGVIIIGLLFLGRCTKANANGYEQPKGPFDVEAYAVSKSVGGNVSAPVNQSNETKTFAFGAVAPGACQHVVLWGFTVRFDTCSRQAWYAAFKSMNAQQQWIACQDDLVMEAPFCDGLRPHAWPKD